MATKLGYTWYPKDWGNSENVFELNLTERGLYRELIDLAMLNDNKTEIKLDVWCRKFAIDLDGLKSILGKLSILNLIVVNGENLFIPSCESRLNLVRGGRNGGKVSKPTSKPTSKPIESLEENIEKPIPNQIEKKIKEKEKENIDTATPFSFFNSLINLGAEKDLANDWIKVRKTKKATNTKTAFNKFVKQFEASGYSINEILEKCIEKSWSGFDSEWFKKPSITTNNGIGRTNQKLMTYDD